MPTPLLLRLALVIAALLGWALTRVAPQHRPAARALAALAALDVTRGLWAGHAPPQLDAAAFLAFYAVEAALALAVLARAPWWPPIAVWAGAAVALALRWGAVHPSLPSFYTAAFTAALLVQLASLAVYLWRRAGALPSTQHGVAILLAVSSIADIPGPWLAGAPAPDWHLGAWASLSTWIIISAWEVWRWVTIRGYS